LKLLSGGANATPQSLNRFSGAYAPEKADQKLGCAWAPHHPVALRLAAPQVANYFLESLAQMPHKRPHRP